MSDEAAGAGEFYASSVDTAEQLMEAAKIAGLDKEIALLRRRLQREVNDKEAGFDVLLKGTRLLMQAVLARYRMTPQRAEELAEALERATEHLAAQFRPREDEEDV